MKNLKLIGFLMILASSLMFIQCTSDPIEGPQGLAGIDGIDGTDGVNGVDGVDGTASCVACHNVSHRADIKDAFALSSHGQDAEGLSVGENRSSCTQCHTSQGYIDFVTNGKVTGQPYPDANQKISCTTCHNKHSTFDFENDGHDFALRNIDGVALTNTDASYVIDYNNSSNNCVTCHQPRSKAPVDDGTGLYLQANSRFYPHYGGQSTMLEGIQGAFIAGGSTAYPGVGTAAHRTGSSCVACHMNSSTDGLTGGHTFKRNNTVCTTCHTTVPTEVAGLAADMATLHDKLFELGLIDEAGSTIKQTELIPFKTAQALWNYKTVEEDGSHGIHNPNYAKALIKNALQAVQ
jgi:hypothetical protein